VFFWQALGRCLDAVPALELRRGELFVVRDSNNSPRYLAITLSSEEMFRETAREVVDDMM